MKCQICQQNDAILHIEPDGQGTVSRALHICGNCAQELSFEGLFALSTEDANPPGGSRPPFPGKTEVPGRKNPAKKKSKATGARHKTKGNGLADLPVPPPPRPDWPVEIDNSALARPLTGAGGGKGRKGPKRGGQNGSGAGESRETPTGENPTMDEPLEILKGEIRRVLLENRQLICEHCGHTVPAFQETGKLGCAACYRRFEVILDPVVRHYQRAAAHRGRYPRHWQQVRDYLLFRHRRRAQQARIRAAVRVEDYEEAARLKKEIENWRARIQREETS